MSDESHAQKILDRYDGNAVNAAVYFHLPVKIIKLIRAHAIYRDIIQ